ncbi:hypothetical protein CsatB_028560 [Cannabis sativa]
MARNFNMVSEHFPPLNANMATGSAAGISNNGLTFNGAQATQTRAQPSHELVIKEPQPAEFLTEEDRVHNKVNQIFIDWEVQDQLLVSWLLCLSVLLLWNLHSVLVVDT